MNIEKLSCDAPSSANKSEIKAINNQLQNEMAELQKIMRAQNKYSLLIVLQGMDASGKDGLVKDVFKKIPAFGIKVYSFKQPSKEELSHGFLWRIHKQTPKKGEISVFNRSHYEDVLVTRVLGYTSDDLAKKRFELINDFEKMLAQSNTIVLKFMLNVSKEKQKERLIERLTIPSKYYKHSDGDWETRKDWNKYMAYYNECIIATQKFAPWYIVPSNQNWYKTHIVSLKIVEAMRTLPLKYPPLNTSLNINKL